MPDPEFIVYDGFGAPIVEYPDAVWSDDGGADDEDAA